MAVVSGDPAAVAAFPTENAKMVDVRVKKKKERKRREKGGRIRGRMAEGGGGGGWRAPQ